CPLGVCLTSYVPTRHKIRTLPDQDHTTEATLFLTERQCSLILDWVAARSQNGLVLRAFLASMALAALRPEEGLALRVRDLEFDEDDSGVLLIHSQGRQRRLEEATGAVTARRVPACPDLVGLLKAEIARRDLRPDDLVFVLDDGRPLTASAYREVWRQARSAVLESHEIESPLGRNVAALRDACIAAWLRNGDQTAAHIFAVAECVGMSAPRLAERFACCLRRPSPAEIPWRLLEDVMDLPGLLSRPTNAALRP
ncbi:tyrosine-type recombinase/integrase, partial [Streptomyces sp. NPDC002519]